jgi:hypothetical protein
VRFRLDGRSDNTVASGVTEETTSSEATLDARWVLRTEFSSVESRCTRACIFSSLGLLVRAALVCAEDAHVRTFGRGVRLCLLRRHSVLAATQLAHGSLRSHLTFLEWHESHCMILLAPCGCRPDQYCPTA